ncbi:MAG: flagellar assembly protein FliH [Rhodobacteraceae bacterium HLUCCO07]|nr:MAG: flagellar assembly protein FliH [Rhodobacteraceae bacterium HLUCCO07]
MGISHLLESFDTRAQAAAPVVSITEADLEESKLKAFEEGYRAGWDDAIKSQSDDKTRISQDFAQNLQQISFAYHEAQAEILRSLKPVLEQVVGVLLPEIASSRFGSRLLSELMTLTEASAQHEVEIVVCPENRPALEAMLARCNISSFKLSAEESLGAGQAYIRLGEIERHIDLDAAVSEIRTAVEGFYQQLENDATKEIENAG